MVYKYGTTILIKPNTKERIMANAKHGDNMDMTLSRILDRVEEYKELYSFSKENRIIINRMLRELPQNKQKEFDETMKDEKGNTKIPIEVGLGEQNKNENR